MISVAGKVLCAGNLTEDILVWPVETVVFNTTTWVKDIVTSFGGNGANTSYAIARLGAEVRLAGLVGADPTGDKILRQLRDAGVDLRVNRCGLPTPATVVVVRSDGARSFLHRPGASNESFAEPLEFVPDLIEGCTHFHLANPFAMPKMRPQAAGTLRRARSAGLTTSIDTGWDALGEWIEVVGPCLPYLDLVFVNVDEAEKLTGCAGPRQAAAFFREHGASATVVKLGAEGCRVFDGRRRFFDSRFRGPGSGHHGRRRLLRGSLPRRTAPWASPGWGCAAGQRRRRPERPESWRYDRFAEL